ncbi:MAG: sulfite exporter TauE/SafE family protein [Actinobacteria bacterium]|nr:sulfite exporter TauE/SafE family protein [Actinomycetota bacterium]
MVYQITSVIIGFLTGVFSGIFGIGGGLVSTPLIRILLNVPPIIAVGTTLPVYVPTAIAGGYTYYKERLINYKALLWCSVSGIIGVIAGAYITKFISGHYLLLGTALVILFTGIKFLKRNPNELSAGQENLQTRLNFIITGFVSGFLGGLLGLGGGFLMIPLFVQWLKMPVRESFGTNLIVVALISLPGSIIHYYLNHIDILVVITLILGVIHGGYFGSRLALRLKEEKLAKGFGVLLIVVSLYFAYSEILSMRL